MKRRSSIEMICVVLALAGSTIPAAAEPDAVKLFADNCAECHGADRLGRLGPALLPENLGRMMGTRAAAVIADGRAATQMPGFAAKLSKEEISALAAYIPSPLPAIGRGPGVISGSGLTYLLATTRFGPSLLEPKSI